MRHILNISDLSAEEIAQLIETADDIEAHPERYEDMCRHRILATLFFEPSTRTRLSFESAMLSLGGQVLGIPDPGTSSAAKGESIADTMEVVNSYADIVAIRHPQEGAPAVAARHATVPVINAGDGGHYHPTQTLADLLTIHREKGRLERLTIGLCGDLKYGRTVHSLIGAMTRYAGIRFVLIAPEELQLPEFAERELQDSGMEYVRESSLLRALPELDILYMTRVQQERFSDAAEYERLKDTYVLTADKMKLARPDLCVMHPLPRVGEIAPEVDSDPRACYFRQARYGRLMRMALILKLLGRLPGGAGEAARTAESPVPGTHPCENPRCISVHEAGIAPLYYTGRDGILRCAYCDREQSGGQSRLASPM